MGWLERKRAEVTGVHNEARPGSNGGRARAGRNVGGEPARPHVRLPLAQGYMVARDGNRAGDGRHPMDECGRYGDCLAAAARSPWAASCAPDCRWWAQTVDG